MRAILIVRLGALGDIVHALPAAAALRDRFPAARIDWVVDERYQDVLSLAPVVDRRIVLRSRSLPVWRRIVDLRRALAGGAWDVAVDAQGLLKSAAVARWSGARRVLGFAAPHLREPAARLFYTETCDPGDAAHVIDKNLALAGRLGARADVASALLTGNVARAARIKLEHFDLWSCFACGAYGDDAPSRDELVPIAVDRARRQGIDVPSAAQVVVVGDTPLDIRCAQRSGARSVAVATGPFDEAALRRHGADSVLPDLADTGAFMDLLQGGSGRSPV